MPEETHRLLSKCVRFVQFLSSNMFKRYGSILFTFVHVLCMSELVSIAAVLLIYSYLLVIQDTVHLIFLFADRYLISFFIV